MHQRLLAVVIFLCTVACAKEAWISTVLPDDGRDLAVVALVESDPAGRYPVLANTQLIRVASGGGPLRAVTDADGMLRIVVFLYAAPELTEVVAPGTDPATLPERVEVVPATGGEVLPGDGRSDWVSEAFLPEDGVDVPTSGISSDPLLQAVRDRVEAQLMLFVVAPDAGLDAAADTGVDGGGGGDTGVDAGTDAATDAGTDAGCTFGPFSAPTNLGAVNSTDNDNAPSTSADGLTLYFSSNRGGGADIWYATRPDVSSSFGTAANLSQVNTADNENGPSISADGLTLYFTSDRPGGIGPGADTWYTTRPDTSSAFGAAMNLGTVNSTNYDWGPSISADELALYFASDRPGGAGADIWYATRPNVFSSFGVPVNLSAINTAAAEGDPSISADGLTLYFANDMAAGEILFTTRPDVSSAFTAASFLGAVNSADLENHPFISTDGSALYFVSNRAGGQGSRDIWVAMRSCL